MFYLLCLIFGKGVLVVVKRAALVFLERALEDEPKSLIVFTLTGSLCAVIVLFGKVLTHFVT